MRIALIDLYTNGHHLKYAGELAKFLIKKKHKVTFITLNYDEKVKKFKKDIPEVKIFTVFKNEQQIPKTYLGQLKLQRKFYPLAFKAAKSFNAEITHLLYLDMIMPLSKIASKKWPFKVFATSFWLASMVVTNQEDSKKLKVLNKVNRYVFKKILKKKFISKIFAQNVYPSEHKQTLEKALNLREAENKKILYLHDPIYEKFYLMGSKLEARKKLSLPQGQPILLFFGELTRSKGLDILIEAVIKSKKKFTLVIAGKPNFFDQQKIAEYKTRLGLGQKIIERLGFVPEEDVANYFLASDAVTMPYRKEYSLGTSGILMQACCAKRPLIASDVGTIGKLIKQQHLGLAVKCEDINAFSKGIVKFLENKQLVTRQAEESATEYLDQASFDNVAPEIVKAYES